MMKQFQRTRVALLLILTLGSALSRRSAAQDLTQSPSFEVQAQLADMRSAAIRGDRTQIPAMIKALDPGMTQYHIRTALRALSELQATEALPAIDAVISRNKGTTLAGFARVVKARIMAESGIVLETTEKQSPRKNGKRVQSEVSNGAELDTSAQATLDRFLTLLNLDTAKIKDAVAKAADKNAPVIAKDPEGTAVYAQQEIADMALHSDPAYLILPKVKELDYSQYPGATLKMKITPLAHEDRVKWLIDDLSMKKAVASKENYEIQLAIDEELPASHYAARVLKTMKEKQASYAPAGFHALFIVLDGVWENKDHEIIATFAANTDPKIRHSSSYYPHYKHQSMAGY